MQKKKKFLLSVLEEYCNFMCKTLITKFPDFNKMMWTAVLPESVRQNTACALMRHSV